MPMREWDVLDLMLLAAGATVLALWFRARRPGPASGTTRRTLVPLLLALLLAALIASWAYQRV